MDAAPEPTETPRPDDPGAWLLGSEERQTVRLCLTVIGVLSTGSLIGVAFSLYLVNHYPLLLLALSPLGRHMWLVAPTVNPLAFVAVLMVRRMLFYVACFHLGRALGPKGLVWVEQRAGRFAGYVRWLERVFSRWSHPVVLLATGPTVSGLAGISGMSQRVYLALAAPGLLVRLTAVVLFADYIRDYIESALAWIDEIWVPGTVVMVGLVLVYRWRRRAPTVPVEGPPDSQPPRG